MNTGINKIFAEGKNPVKEGSGIRLFLERLFYYLIIFIYCKKFQNRMRKEGQRINSNG